MPLADILMVAISQMVSLVPEGLPVAMTIALAVGMQRMAGARRDRAPARRGRDAWLHERHLHGQDRHADEERNDRHRAVAARWTHDRSHRRRLRARGNAARATGARSRPRVTPHCALILEAGALCNDAQLVPPDVRGNALAPARRSHRGRAAHARAEGLRRASTRSATSGRAARRSPSTPPPS